MTFAGEWWMWAASGVMHLRGEGEGQELRRREAELRFTPRDWRNLMSLLRFC